jgi:hypothetical protein
MAHLVEIRYIAGQPARLTAEMLAWLDRRQINPEAFACSSGCPGVAFRISFHNAEDAAAFADAFGGRLAAIDPQGASHWRSPPAAPDQRLC